MGLCAIIEPFPASKGVRCRLELAGVMPYPAPGLPLLQPASLELSCRCGCGLQVMVPKLIHPLPPSTPRTPGSPSRGNGDEIEEDPPTPHPTAGDTWMQVRSRHRERWSWGGSWGAWRPG